MKLLFTLLGIAVGALAIAGLVAWRRERRRAARARDNLERWMARRSLHPERGNLPFHTGAPHQGDRP